jgi:RES domain
VRLAGRIEQRLIDLASGLARRAVQLVRSRAPWLSTANPYVWRVGYHVAPLDFPPREHCAWNHRFDDPHEEHRTLYCAEQASTCLREVLADLRPDTKARAEYAQLQANQGKPPQELHRPAREVSLEWRELHAPARATVEREGNLGNLTDSGVREELANRHAELLDAYDMPYLDISQVTAENRIVTQTISRDLNETGAVGILFHSNRDGHAAWRLWRVVHNLCPPAHRSR